LSEIQRGSRWSVALCLHHFQGKFNLILTSTNEWRDKSDGYLLMIKYILLP
jgi:hypothetical protein